MGVMLDYKSVRHGLAHFAIGGLRGSAAVLFGLDSLNISIRHNFSTPQYAHIVFWVQFDNKNYPVKPLVNFPSLSHLNGATFFRVFPFSILMDSSLCILQVGANTRKLFPIDTPLVGRLLDEIFRLIRPDIHVEWHKILSYGRHIVFLMENRLPLRVGTSGKIRLKGQMKYLESQNMLWFLCHPVLGSAEDLVSAGLCLNDLNLFDSTSDLLITGIHQEQELVTSRFRRQICEAKAHLTRENLSACRKNKQRLLQTIVPRHVAELLESGTTTNSIYEYQPLVTILFVHLMDFAALSSHVDVSQTVTFLSKIAALFDSIADKYDVFRVGMKVDAVWMMVAGIHGQSYLSEETTRPQLSLRMPPSDDEDEPDMSQEKPSTLNSTETIARVALEIQCGSGQILNLCTNKPVDLKFGLHSGMAVAGVIGTRNYQYCLFGETVAIANQMAISSEIGRIHLSQVAFNHLASNPQFSAERRDETDIAGRGLTDTYWLTGEKRMAGSMAKINRSAT